MIESRFRQFNRKEYETLKAFIIHIFGMSEMPRVTIEKCIPSEIKLIMLIR